MPDKKVGLHVLRTEQINLTTSSALSSTNITIPQLKETLYEMMTNNPNSIQGDINNDLYIALSKSVIQDKQVAPTDSYKDAKLRKRSHDDQDDPKNHKGEKRSKIRKFTGQSSLRNDRVMSETSDHDRSSAEDRFNEVVDSYQDPDEPQYGEMVPDNSTLTFSKRFKRCLNVDKLDLSKLEEFRKDGYEFFGNRFMSKAKC
uniref:Uncharacterized protein n=1 Tax=Tanacetum cinerariifolium TaxID=118510 RepID=A0A6L2M5T0_TANCI|nr:hypothetical protein [Tanacetum cinerariifolium]